MISSTAVKFASPPSEVPAVGTTGQKIKLRHYRRDAKVLDPPVSR